jgi:hypothetical protein
VVVKIENNIINMTQHTHARIGCKKITNIFVLRSHPVPTEMGEDKLIPQSLKPVAEIQLRRTLFAGYFKPWHHPFVFCSLSLL